MPFDVDTHKLPSGSAVMPCMQLFGNPSDVPNRMVSPLRLSCRMSPFCVPIQIIPFSACAQLYFVLYFSHGAIQGTDFMVLWVVSYSKSPPCPPMSNFPGANSVAKLITRLRAKAGCSDARRMLCPFWGSYRYKSFRLKQASIFPSASGRQNLTVLKDGFLVISSSFRVAWSSCRQNRPCRVQSQKCPCVSFWIL